MSRRKSTKKDHVWVNSDPVRLLIFKSPSPSGEIVYAFVSVAKNACSSLKAKWLIEHYPNEFTIEKIQNMHGFKLHEEVSKRGESNGMYLTWEEFRKSPYSGIPVFAIWRDPVKRLISVYRDKVIATCIEEKPGLFLTHSYPLFVVNGLEGNPISQFIDFTQYNQTWIRKGSEFIDIHLRPQHMFYDIGEIKAVIDIDNLKSFMSTVGGIPKVNVFGDVTIPDVSDSEKELIRNIYAADYTRRVHLKQLGKFVSVGNGS